jgi:integrase
VTNEAVFPAFPQWQRAVDAFLSAVTDRSGSRNTYKAYRCILRLFFADISRDPASYLRSDMYDFLRQTSVSLRNYGQPLAANSKNARITVISQFYKFASDYEIRDATGKVVSLYSQPLPTRGIHHLSRDKKPRGMSIEEFEQFIQAIPDATLKGIRDRCLMLVFFYTALRRMEVLRLRWGDISQSTIIEQSGNTRPGYLLRFSQKGHSRETSTSELPSEAMRSLETYLKASGRLDTITPSDPLFVAMRRGSGRKQRSDYEPLSPSAVNAIFQEYLISAGLQNRDFSLHSLRHTSARIRYECGEDVLSIQRRLGHSSLITTQNYLYFMAGNADPGAKLLEKRFAHLTPR